LDDDGYAVNPGMGLRRTNDKLFENLKLRQFLPVGEVIRVAIRDLPPALGGSSLKII
jgi:hypothetical protein